ncbi:hypothetical protein SAY86_017731 [Trapa natans]|uniref:Uncharacterized protein n=1 Tax=Trapa natans TaxID=22666 RepID=A0AAN7R5B7_TRANT|nr:hypothetical protein SAY86_017731 [Trapa natans]
MSFRSSARSSNATALYPSIQNSLTSSSSLPVTTPQAAYPNCPTILVPQEKSPCFKADPVPTTTLYGSSISGISTLRSTSTRPSLSLSSAVRVSTSSEIITREWIPSASPALRAYYFGYLIKILIGRTLTGLCASSSASKSST